MSTLVHALFCLQVLIISIVYIMPPTIHSSTYCKSHILDILLHTFVLKVLTMGRQHTMSFVISIVCDCLAVSNPTIKISHINAIVYMAQIVVVTLESHT